MKKLLTFLILWPVLVSAQNYGGIDYICGAAAGKTVLFYQMPDTTNAIRTTTANARGFYRCNLGGQGQYLVRYVQGGGDTVNVSRFSYTPVVGIGGDSISDARAIVQAALDSLPAGGAGIKLPPGVHLWKRGGATITLNKDNATIEGTGNNCVLKADSAFNLYMFTASNGLDNLTVRNLVLVGNKANQTAGGGFNVNGSTIRRVNFENVTFRHFYDNAAVFANGVSDIYFTNCYFDSIGTAGQTSTTAAFPLYFVTSPSNVHITNCTFTWWSGTAAIRINNNCKNFWLKGNIYRSNDKTGTADRRAVFADSGVTGACDNINASYDKAVDIDENGFFFNGVNNSTLDHCTADSCGNNGFELNGGNLTIDHDQARRCGAVGIAVNNGKGGSISECLTEFNNTRGIYVFASTLDSCVGLTIIGNIARNNSQSPTSTHPGIEVQAVAGGSPGKVRRIPIMGNSCYDTQSSKTQKYGIQTTGDVDYYTVVGNTLTPNVTGGLNDGSTGAGNKYVPAGGNP